MIPFKVKQITYDDTKPWLLNIHYAKRMAQVSLAFGLFDKEELIGVCTFGQPASPNVCKGICGVEKDCGKEANENSLYIIDENDEYANLIASAPELYKSLKDMIDIIEEFRISGLAQGSEYINRIDKAQQTIKQAEGK